MKDEDKTKEQLIAELAEHRQKITELENALQNQNHSATVSEQSLPISPFTTGMNESFVSFNHEYQQPVNNSRKYHISQLIDIPLLQQLFDSFFELTGIMHAFLDVDTNIMSRTGWSDICLNFHRICPETECRCKQSDSFITDHLQDGPYIRYRCLNGLIDYATPIIVEGQHLATIYMGQLFNEPPNEEYFRQQAREFGFDEAAYIEALHKVSIVPEHRIKPIMQFYSKLGQVLASMGLERLRRIEAAEEKFSKAFQYNPAIMAIASLSDFKYIDVNEAFCNIKGYQREEVLGRTIMESNHSHSYSIIKDMFKIRRKLMEEGIIKNVEINFFAKSSEKRVGLLSAVLLNIDGQECILEVIEDVTELRQMEVEMTRLDRLNVVGEMAASIGHEIRNPMTTVRGYLQLLREKKDYHQEIEWFDLMIEELDRANSIITEFLSLAKNKIVELNLTSLNTIIDRLSPILQAKAISQDQHIKLELNDLPDLLLDTKEIQQLILNLVNNGLESMSSAGIVTIRTFTEKDKVVLAVQDQGHGIDRELLDKLGTPFLTTKEQGAGLGLAVCYRIATRHNAKIDIETSSIGTTLFVRFSIPIVATTVS